MQSLGETVDLGLRPLGGLSGIRGWLGCNEYIKGFIGAWFRGI